MSEHKVRTPACEKTREDASARPNIITHVANPQEAPQEGLPQPSLRSRDGSVFSHSRNGTSVLSWRGKGRKGSLFSKLDETSQRFSLLNEEAKEQVKKDHMEQVVHSGPVRG
jgi:hypothetical protein